MTRFQLRYDFQNSRDKEKDDINITDSRTKPLVMAKTSGVSQSGQRSTAGGGRPKYSGYEIAMHSVRLQQSGTMISVDLTWSLSSELKQQLIPPSFAVTFQPP